MTYSTKTRRAIGVALSDIKAYRKSRPGSPNQQVFWSRFGTTQSGGSRYESWRDMPDPVRILIALHVAGSVTDTDLEDAEIAKTR